MDFFAPQKEVSKAEKELRPLLFDDGCQILSSFELNKIASLTYGDVVCDEIFELIESIVAQPMNHSTLTVQKTLVVLKHILIYGSAKCVNSGYGVGKFVESLTTFNTVLAAQQQQGATAFLQRLQGGGVDRGGPIREAALQVQKLLLNINDLQRIRNESASADSLVPIGDENKVAFITDEVRHFLLKRRIEKQERIEIKSNLAKSQGGFGAGYSAKDGKNVVGAAHGIEEMLKMAKRGKSKFTDDENMHGPSPEDKILEELAAEAKREKELAAQAAASRNVALLDVEGTNAPKPSGGDFDLLDFGSQVQSPAVPGLHSTTDLLSGFGNTNSGGTGETNDLLGLSGGMSQNTSDLVGLTAGGLGAGGDGLFGLPQTSQMQTSTQIVDPFAPLASTSQSSMAPPALNATDLGGMMRKMSLGSTSLVPSNEDRFAALDALAELPGFQASIPSSNSFVPTIGGPQLPTTQSMVTPGSGHVAPTYGEAREGNSGNDNPWVMGGSAGTGLDPLAPAPAVPPPPLPSS